MTYCLDISAIPYGTGVSRYTSNLARSLQREAGNHIRFFGTAFRNFSALRRYGGNLYPLPPSIMTSMFHRFNIPIETLAGPIDVFHSWDWYMPSSKKAALVTTIHDLALFKYPDIAHPEIKAHHQEVLDRIKVLKPQIITVSEATKEDAVELFGLNPDDITVVYNAMPEEHKVDSTNLKPMFSKPYFLMVGTLEPRKNYPRQIEAWRKFKHEFDLVIVGKDGWEQIAEEPGLHRIQATDSLTLAALYRHASLLMYCSLAEGFGLPILEAQYHSCPVVTSNCSSMKEIASPQVVLADPLDVASMQAGIESALQMNKQMIVEDTRFSWKKAARETLEVYKKAIQIRE